MGYNQCGQLNNSEANIIVTIHLNFCKTKIKMGEKNLFLTLASCKSNIARCLFQDSLIGLLLIDTLCCVYMFIYNCSLW